MAATIESVAAANIMYGLAAGTMSDTVARNHIALAATDGRQDYAALPADERADVDAVIAKSKTAREMVVATIAARAKLDKAYYDALVAGGFSDDQAVAIVARQGVAFLFGV